MAWWKRDPVALARDRYNKSTRLMGEILTKYNQGLASQSEVDQMRTMVQCDKAALEAAEKEQANANVAS